MTRKGGSITNQVNLMLEKSGMVHIDEGFHRHDERDAFIDTHGRNPTPQERSSFGIYDGATFEKYKAAYKQLGEFCKAEFGIQKLRQIEPEHIKAFIVHKIEDAYTGKNGHIYDGVSQNTANNYIKAFSKMDDMMNRAFTNVDKDFSGVCKECYEYARAVASPPDTETRAFNNPQAVIENITDPRSRLIAEIQLATGLRVSDASFIRLNPDGESIAIRSKGGYRISEYKLPAGLYAKVAEMAGGADKIRLNSYSNYINDLKDACARAGESYTGSHAFRHNYAKASYENHISEGMSSKESAYAVSEELFHHREEIVGHYLR